MQRNYNFLKPVADLNAEKGSSKLTVKDLDTVEKYADKLYKSLGVDVEFTRHFLDRVNDARNIKQITIAELIVCSNNHIKNMERDTKIRK